MVLVFCTHNTAHLRILCDESYVQAHVVTKISLDFKNHSAIIRCEDYDRKITHSTP